MPEPPDTVYHEGRWLTFGKKDDTDWEYVSRPGLKGVVGILAITDQREIVLVEQFRPPLARKTIEIPAGLAGDDPYKADEPLLSAAKRELYEETGFEAKDWWSLCDGPSSTGTTDEIVNIFMATGLRRVAEREIYGVDGEQIRVHVVRLGELHDFIDKKRDEGILTDFKVQASLWMAQRHPMWPA